MNGEIRIWDVRAPEKPLYESLAQPHGLAGLAVHTGAPVLATYVRIPYFPCRTDRSGLPHPPVNQ
jgi:regulator-associated protein of mTOR